MSEEKTKVVYVKSESSPGVAAVLSFFIPGLGQLYKGQLSQGVAWLICILIGYFFLVIPGLILHILCVIDALRGLEIIRKMGKFVIIFLVLGLMSAAINHYAKSPSQEVTAPAERIAK